jgi:hypothetical protein
MGNFRESKGVQVLILGTLTPLLGYVTIWHLRNVVKAVTTHSVTVVVGGKVSRATFDYSMSAEPVFYALGLLNSLSGMILFGGSAIVVGIAAYCRLRNRRFRSLFSHSMFWRVWCVVGVLWIVLSAVLPILILFNVL